MANPDPRAYEDMSPFEIKDALIQLARASGQKSAHAFLNAGRGNPNWIATRAREAFFTLGQFGLAEAARVMDRPAGLSGMPREAGIAARMPPVPLIGFALHRFGFDPDAFVHELVDAIMGDNYPEPARMLVHVEQVVHEYLLHAMCGGLRPAGRFDLFATEGASAAICYVLRSLKSNRLLRFGDHIALGTPIFSPYLEIPELEDFGLRPVFIEATAENAFQYNDTELEKLLDPRVKAFFLVNPGNPTSVAIGPAARAVIVRLVREQRPDLMLLTDDVYATFVDGFRSLMADLPANTIGVYSFSKYFGSTGWRLGAIALHQDNIFDPAIAALPETDKLALDNRYGSLAPDPREIRFIDRIVADSRDVALRHTAGLSGPQQAMMALFALAELADGQGTYRQACLALPRKRQDALHEGMGIAVPPDPLSDHYYGLIDVESWLRAHAGDTVADFVIRTVHPLDIVFRLARDHGIVLLNGGGFHAPDWTVRVSYANLDDTVYRDIGRAIRTIAQDYIRLYEQRQEHPPCAKQS